MSFGSQIYEWERLCWLMATVYGLNFIMGGGSHWFVGSMLLGVAASRMMIFRLSEP